MSDEARSDSPAGPGELSEEQLVYLASTCGIENLMEMESVRDILKKKQMIKATPCELTHARSLLFNVINCYMKFETLQHCGSCIARGAAYAILQHHKNHSGKPIISASLGNFAIALCHYASQYKIPITIIMPKVTPISKVSMCEQSLDGCEDSNVKIEGENLKESVQIAMDIALREDMVYVGEDHPDVIMGQTSVGLEILENVKNVDVIVVPIASGAVIAGVAMAARIKKKDIKIIAVQLDKHQSLNEARLRCEPIVVYPNYYSPLTSELAVPIGTNAFKLANKLIDELITVSESSIAAAMVQVMECEGYTVEGSGAMGLAAILYSNYFQTYVKTSKNVVLLLTDGNLDPTFMDRCIQIGLYTQLRLLEFTVELSNWPQYLEKFITDLRKFDIYILKIEYFPPNVHITCETKNESHANQIKDFLDNNKFSWSGFKPIRNLD